MSMFLITLYAINKYSNNDFLNNDSKHYESSRKHAENLNHDPNDKEFFCVDVVNVVLKTSAVPASST